MRDQAFYLLIGGILCFIAAGVTGVRYRNAKALMKRIDEPPTR
jgi:hypothetical protein